MVGRRTVRSVVVVDDTTAVAGLVCCDAGTEAEEDKATMLGSRMRSSWKWVRTATKSLENSRAPCVPASMGAVNRGQRTVQACRMEGRLRAAARPSVSWT